MLTNWIHPHTWFQCTGKMKCLMLALTGTNPGHLALTSHLAQSVSIVAPVATHNSMTEGRGDVEKAPYFSYLSVHFHTYSCLLAQGHNWMESSGIHMVAGNEILSIQSYVKSFWWLNCYYRSPSWALQHVEAWTGGISCSFKYHIFNWSQLVK